MPLQARSDAYKIEERSFKIHSLKRYEKVVRLSMCGLNVYGCLSGIDKLGHLRKPVYVKLLF